MQAVATTRSRRVAKVLLTLLLLLWSAAAGYAQTLGADTNTGLAWSTISYLAGGGTVITDPPPNGTPAASVAQFTAAALAVDSQGNIYLGTAPTTGSGGGLVYMIYKSGATVPPWLAAVTTQASPAATPVAGDLYQIAGGVDGTANCSQNGIPTYCINGPTALQASFGGIGAMAFDAHDNLYIVDGYAGVGAVRRIDYASTAVTTVAGQLNNPTVYGNTNVGDDGPATQATLLYTTDIKLDAAGNLYLADYDSLVRIVYEGGAVPPILAAEGVTPQPGNIYSVAGQPGQFCPGAGLCGDGGPAQDATFGYDSGVEVDGSGNVYVTDTGGSTVRVIYAGGTQPPLLSSLTNAAVTGDIYTIAGQQFVACSVAPCGDGGAALSAQLNTPLFLHVDATGDVYVDDAGDQALRRIDAAGYISDSAGTESAGTPAGSSSAGTNATNAIFVALFDFALDTQNNLYLADQNYVWQAAPVLPQMVNFPTLPPVTYGTAPVTLDAVAETSAGAPTGLPISYTVTSGPGTISGSELIVTGAGTIQITATQSGSSTYSAASAMQSITVNKAVITVTANNASRFYDTANPAFTASYTGLVNGDSAAGALTGSPDLSTTAVLLSPVGTYPLTVSQGSLAALNYTFLFVPGTLFITGTAPQTITFPPLAPINYGQLTSLTLTASASSGLAITYTLGASSPATVSGSLLRITGAGTIAITANQYGNNTYTPAASVTQSFVVTPAQLTIGGPVFTLPYAVAIDPQSFPPPTITGLVSGDTQAEISGKPLYTTTAAGSPHAGASFPVQVALGTIKLLPSIAGNYVFSNVVPGNLTIVPAAQTLVFNKLNSLQYGSVEQLFAVAKDANGMNLGLPVTLTVNGAAVNFNGAASTVVTPSASIGLNGIAVGAFSVTASQAGDGNYAPAPVVTQSAQVQPAPLFVTANSLSREFGAPNPALTYYIGCPGQTSYSLGCFTNNDTDIPSVITGAPIVATDTDATTAAGSYPINVNAGTLIAPNYTIVAVNGTLTILSAGSYTIASSAPTLTVPAGQSRQLTLTVTPVNLYQGTVTMSCGALPANVTCIFSPATYNFSGATNAGGGANPGLGTLTINTVGGQPVVGAISRPPLTALPAFLLPIGWIVLLCLPGTRKLRAARARLVPAAILLLLGAGALGISACGSSSSAGSQLAAAGTVNLTITGTGSTLAGRGDVVQTLSVNVVIQ